MALQLDEKVKEVRKELNLTQKQLGDLLGIPPNTIARIERKEIRTQHPVVLNLALNHLRLQMTPTMKKKLELLAMSKEELAEKIT